MDTRKRIYNVGFVGEDKLQKRMIMSLMSRNLKEKKKSLKKILSNPNNYVINNLSNGHVPTLSLVKTPGDTKYMKNILSGCFVSDFLLFVIQIEKENNVDDETKMKVEEIDEEENISEKKFSFEKFKEEISSYNMVEILRYTKKPASFILIDKEATLDSSSVFKTGKNEKLSQNEISLIKQRILDLMRELKVYTDIQTIILQGENYHQKLENFILQDVLTKRVIVRLRTISSSLSRVNSKDFKNQVKEDEDFDGRIMKETRIFVLRAFKNYDTGRLVLFSKVLSGALETCSIEKYWITQNFDKQFRFDDIQIGGIRVPKCVAGEVVALSFKADDVFPFFLRKSLIFENEPKMLDKMEKGVQFIKAKVFLFGKDKFRMKKGSKFSMHYCANSKGVVILELDIIDEEKQEYLVMLGVGNLGLDVYENCQELGVFAVLEKRRFLGYGEILEVITG